LLHRFTAPIVTIAALALFNVALPEPIVLDLLGTGLATIGLGLICGEFI
jgi:hypothetical protein